MSLLSRIKSAILGEQPPKLRNRAGGLAYIKPYGKSYGADAIAGQIVTTVRLEEHGLWVIEPEPVYFAKAPFLNRSNRLVMAGDRCEVIALADEFLQPLRDPGYDERSQELDYLPAVPKLIPLKVKGEVS